MVRINGLFHLLINEVLLGVITHVRPNVFTNFLGHPSSWWFQPIFQTYHSQTCIMYPTRVENKIYLKPPPTSSLCKLYVHNRKLIWTRNILKS